MSGIDINGQTVELTNLDKLYFPEAGITKGDMIDYYIRFAQYILPWLRNRPFTMVPYPHGAGGKSFYQKQIPDNAPEFLESAELPSERRGSIKWSLVNNLPSLVYMANRACIEMHAWFSRLPKPDEPDVAIFDLDPSGNTGYSDAAAAAKLIRIILDDMKIKAFPKTSGATGLHIVIPIEPAPFEKVRGFLTGICRMVEQADPGRFTTERTIAKRGDRVYLDAVQNARGKTIPSPYSVRATAAATVSAPLSWDEVEGGAEPGQFTIRTIGERIKQTGDLYAPLYAMRQRLPAS
jgi:bifunctional non-homologous end joining protein LigD